MIAHESARCDSNVWILNRRPNVWSPIVNLVPKSTEAVSIHPAQIIFDSENHPSSSCKTGNIVLQRENAAFHTGDIFWNRL